MTWVYMATLAFLAVASFGLMPLWFVAGWNVFSVLEGIAFFATLLILPAMFGGAWLGLRTYRSVRREATRAGVAVGAVVGLSGFAFLLWLEGVSPGDAPLYWLAVPPVLAGAAATLYALFANSAPMTRRRGAVLLAAGLVGITALALFAADPSFVRLVVALVSTAAGAAAGWTAGIGHARAGGDDMIPPGAVKK